MFDKLILSPIHLFHWLTLSSLLFSIGIYGILSRRNAVGVFMGAELALNSAALNFVIFNHYGIAEKMDGEIMALFIIAIAAAEILVGIALLVALFKQAKTVDVLQMSQLREGSHTLKPIPVFSQFVPPLSKPDRTMIEPLSKGGA